MKVIRNQFHQEMKEKLKINKPTYHVELEINTGKLCEITLYWAMFMLILAIIS